ncbi:AraC family transcriptional regulator [Jannaschia sp. EhC01]|nr:AraC family transcriptional regulator [Jannaschia sp. EhC01]
MLSLPVPIFFALILAFLALRTFLWSGRSLLAAFLAACALQSLILAGAVGYEIAGFRTILPVTASTIPPLAWLTFRSALITPVALSEAAPHLIVPLFCLFCRFFAPVTIDVVVPLIFTGYGIAILLALRTTVDLPLARIEAGGVTNILWRLLGWVLIASAFTDVFVAVAYISGNPAWGDRIVSIFASIAILSLGALSSLPNATGEVDCEDPAPPARDLLPDAETLQQDKDILEKLDTLLTREKTYVDPSLTVLRLSRRVHVPEKQLSAAVNRTTGANVSRYINKWRIEHACGLLIAGQNVTDAMLGSGFNTKSNFNREFLRVMSLSPRDWLTSRRSTAGQNTALEKTENGATD